MLEATLYDANELYVLFSLLSSGYVIPGDAEGKLLKPVPLALVVRQEHDGPRRYVLQSENVLVEGEEMHESFPREDFATVSRWLLDRITEALNENRKTLDLEEIEPFLDALKIYDMQVQTDDRTHLHVALWSVDSPLIGIRIHSRLCGLAPLLGGSRASNIKYEQTGIRFSAPAVHKINWTEDEDNVAEVARRILYIQSMGGVLKYSDVADKVFKSNLLMLDTNLPRILSSMLMALYLDGTARVEEHVALLRQSNPLKLKDELVSRHGFYDYKIRQLLLASVWGMRPTKMFYGRASAIAACLMVDRSGAMTYYSRADEQTFSDYLFRHTRLEKGQPGEDKFGILERENGTYYLKLNLRIGLTRK